MKTSQLNNQGIEDYEIISSEAQFSKSGEIWPDIYLNRSLSGSAKVTIKYKGVLKDILAYCNQRDDEQALGMMKRYIERSEDKIDTEYCNTYDDILICTKKKEEPNFTVTKTKVSDSYNRVIDTYKITSQEKRNKINFSHKYFCIVSKIFYMKHNNLFLLSISISLIINTMCFTYN